MRPTDENQTASRRPNLMSSSRRIGGEINILAMLDGQARKPRRIKGLPRAAWYGSGALLACALLGTAAWMVHEQGDGSFEGRIATGPAVVPLVIAAEPLPNPPLLVPAHGADHPATHAPAPRAQGAAVVDLPAPALAEAHDAAPTPIAETSPPVVPAPPAKRAPVHAAPRIASRTASAPRSAAPQTRQEPAVHPRRAAALAKPKPAPVAVDTDVALISAIIQHASQHGESKDGACSDRPCAPRMSNRP